MLIMKKILVIILVIFIGAVCYGLYIYFEPPRDVKDEKGIEITATAIFDSFIVNENRANQLYLNKAIQFT